MKSLLEALGLDLPEMVVLVGSGGKTALMFGLAAEAAGQGARVVTTTTTRIYPPTEEQAATLILSRDESVLLAKVAAALEAHSPVTAALALSGEDKLLGLPPALVDELFAEVEADLVLVEADGARGLPLKAPGPDEPVIPSAATVLVPVVGLGGLGQPLTEKAVFRPRQFAWMSGLKEGQAVSSDDVARVLFHPRGPCGRAPARARIAAFLNQADLVSPAAARETAQAVLEAGFENLERVVWGSLKDPGAGFEVLQPGD